MEKPNVIKLDIRGSLALINIEGDITSYSEPYLEAAYRQVVQNNAITDLVMVVEKGAYINSGGISALIQILAEMRKTEQRVGLAGVSDHFAKILKMVGVHKLASIYGSLDEALASMDVSL
jgi:anti-anti-sigma factor